MQNRLPLLAPTPSWWWGPGPSWKTRAPGPVVAVPQVDGVLAQAATHQVRPKIRREKEDLQLRPALHQEEDEVSWEKESESSKEEPNDEVAAGETQKQTFRLQ